jgi:hypothetical protein
MRISKLIRKVVGATVSGGALYIAMMVGIIISILLAMFILLARFNQRQVTVFAQNSQLQYNLKSAFQMARSAYFTIDRNDKWMKNIANDDSIKIKRLNWGAYLLITAQTKNRHYALSQSGLYGTTMSADTGLVVSENSRPIGLSGQITFKAYCYLPSAGIKPAFIEGQSYMGAGSNVNYIKKAPYQIPELSERFKKGVAEQQTQLVNSDDSLLFTFPNTLAQSFSHKTIVIEVSRNLTNLHFSENIKIISQNEITIDSTCHFDNVLIIADKVKFKRGFKGSVHVIASDSIVAEKETVFEYPSSFVLSTGAGKEDRLRCIIISENCKFSGGLIAFTSELNGPKVFIKLNASSEINGTVYSSGYLHVEGKLNANVFCGKLMLKTPSAVYENHMLACEIDPAKYAHLLAVPDVLSKNERISLCKNFRN